MIKKAEMVLFAAVAALVFQAVMMTNLQAGGRTLNPPHPLSASLLVNAWHENGRIHLAIGNPLDKDLNLEISVGTADTARNVFGRFVMRAPGHTVSVTDFEPLFQKSVRGDNVISSHVFVSGVDEPAQGLRLETVIQSIHPASLDRRLSSHVAASGEAIVFSLSGPARKGTRFIGVAQKLVLNEQAAPLLPLETSSPRAGAEDIQKLDLSDEDKRFFTGMLDGYYGYIFQCAPRLSLNFSVTAPLVAECGLAGIPMFDYTIDPAGPGGTGIGGWIMVYNPDRMTVKKLSAPRITRQSPEGIPPSPLPLEKSVPVSGVSPQS